MQENTNWGRDQNIINQPQTVVMYPQPEVVRNPVQQKLLVAVKEEVQSRLNQSLHSLVNAELLNLKKESQPFQIRKPLQMVERIGHRSEPLPLDTKIISVFDDTKVNRKLLMLGQPGSGKTTTMLELAQVLVKRAEQDTAQPIPVLLSLSSWKPRRIYKQSSFANWLSQELQIKHQLRTDLSQQWLKNNKLLPMLDGLDEVAPIHQQACATALNDWLNGDLETRPIGLLVCCRIQEYEEVVRNYLFLNGAIELRPLTPDQIDMYLSQFDLRRVWTSTQSNVILRNLLERPLFLSVFGFVSAHNHFNASDWEQCTTYDTQQAYFFDQYWNTVMTRDSVTLKEQAQGILSKTYGKQKLPALRRALIFVAKSLEIESQTELLIERIQPSCLQTQQQIWMYKLISGLIFGLIGSSIFIPIFRLISGSVFGLIEPMVELTIWIISWLILGLVFGLIAGLVFGLVTRLGMEPNTMSEFGTISPIDSIKFSISELNKISPLESIKFSMSPDARRRLFITLLAELIASVTGELIVGLFIGLFVGFVRGLIVGLILGLIVGLTSGLLRGLRVDIDTRIIPNKGIKNSRDNMLLIALINLVCILPLKALLEWSLGSILEPAFLNVIIAIALSILLLFGFAYGGGWPLIQHIALRIVLWINGYAPPRYDLLLDYATERLLLQRIGGRYRFMHKLLQEHFAQMNLS